MSFPYAYSIIVSDGKVMRTVRPAELGHHQAALETALADLLLERRPAASGAAVAAEPAPAAASAAPAPPPSPPASTMTQGEIARAQGYTGDCCSNCAQFKMKQAGHCLVCDACGTTTGCS